ncbi:hypothetical protein [Streptococcus caprae]
MGAITPLIGTKKSALISGLVSGAAGMGGIIISPGMEFLISTYGIKAMLWIFV